MAGIYLHIPFCKQACTYCNFHFSTSLNLKEDLLAALQQEISLQRDFFQGQKVDTIYIGGGTPSLLSADELNRLLDALIKTFKIDELKECTLETNPDDLTNNYVKSLRSTPVNRFSIGIQSFRPEDLLYMNRAHNARQSEFAIKAAQDAGFTNISIDLIYGTPGLNDKAWKENLAKLKTLEIPHFSSYALTVEEGTELDYSIKKKKTAPVDAAQSAGQFELLMETVEQMGYDHYEISNFALPGHHAIHNTNYWRGLPYLGLGPAAHSFNGIDKRQWNVANNPRYIASILQKNEVPFEAEILTKTQRLNEYIMTSLRTMWGCDLEKIGSEWSDSDAQKIREEAGIFKASGQMMEIDNKLILTHKGKLFADGIAGDLFQDEEL